MYQIAFKLWSVFNHKPNPFLIDCAKGFLINQVENRKTSPQIQQLTLNGINYDKF